jgi:Phage P22-like portal protein
LEAEDLATSDEDVVREAKKRLPLAADAESPNRTEALTDLKFGNGDQWPVDVQRDRDTDGRPCLTINITDAMVRRVCNALRENRPRIKSHPVGSQADIQTSKVIDGLIRHIEVSSGADYAYDCGVESAVRGGWGYWRVGSKYVDEKSFDQDLTIEAIQNPFTVYFDPASRAPDGSDAGWCIVSDWIKRDEFQARFGQEGPRFSRLKSMVSAFSFMGAGDEISDWSRKEELRLAEYWRIVTMRDTLYMLTDGRTGFGSSLPSDEAMEKAGFGIATRNGKPIERTVMRKAVEWYLLCGDGVLQKRNWPGKWIPIIPCYGRALDLNGKVVRKGMIRDLRDPARMYNYGQTTLTEVNALQPKAPWMGAKGFMGDDQSAWRDSNRKPIIALEYTPIQNPDGTMAPPPMRQQPQGPNAALGQWVQGSQSDFMAVAGMPHEPDADKKGEVVSGIALRKRQGLSDISHYDFYDNQTRSLRHTGNILVDLIPHFYDTPRMQRIINPDGTPDQVKINERAEDKVKNDLTVGKYDVVIDTGPGYQTKREEAADAMLELLATPLGEMTAKVAGDVVVRSLDFPDSDLIADRMSAMIPGAQIDKNSDIPEKAQIMIAGLQQQLKDANQRTLALQLELQAKHGLEQMRQQGETQRLQIKEEGEDRRAGLKAHTAMHDTHVKAVTAHDVAEIRGATQLLNTNAEAEHNKAAAKEMLSHGEQAEGKTE